jgi:hypothetical protein
MGRPKKAATESAPLEVYFDNRGKKTSIDFDFLNMPWPKAKSFLEAEIMAQLAGDAALTGKIGESVYAEIEKAKENDLDGKLTTKNNIIVLFYDEASHSLKAETAQLEENYDDDDRDGDIDFADPGGGSALRASSRSNPRNLPCPNCGAKNVLTPADRARGYQCDRCADKAERGCDEVDDSFNVNNYGENKISGQDKSIDRHNSTLKMVIDGKQVNINSISLDGIDGKDRPDFADAFASDAEFIDGSPLTDAQLEELTAQYPEFINDRANLIASGG